MRMRKKNIALIVLFTMVLGSFAPSMKVNAEQIETPTPIVADAVVYDKTEVTGFKDLFGKEAPTKEGYYFGGWYMGPSETTAIKYETQKNEIVEANESASEPMYVYAKFVPAYMLNVKAQNASNLTRYEDDTTGEVWATAPNNITSIRMFSAVDSKRYKEVGFHVFVNGKKVSKMAQSKYNETVYDKIVVSDSKGETVAEYTAKQLFGLNSENYDPKLIIAKFINIPEQGWTKSIYVRPYWITFDGIEVRGNGRYLHVEDGIKGYISVPINLQSLNYDADGIAAGKIEVSYDSEKLTFIDSVDGYKTGGVFDAAGVRLLSDGKIRCVGLKRADEDTKEIQNVVPNQFAAVKRPGEELTGDGDPYSYGIVNNMYITLRFKPISGKYATGQGVFLNFDVEAIDFCDSNEVDVSVNVWNSRY